MKMPFTKPQVYTFLKYAVFSVVIILGTIAFNIFSGVYNTIQDAVNGVTVNGVSHH